LISRHKIFYECLCFLYLLITLVMSSKINFERTTVHNPIITMGIKI
jgi:hypothetical protein